MVIQTLESYSRRPFPTLKQFGAFWDGKPISTRWSSFVFLTNDTWTHKTSKQQTVTTTNLHVGLDRWNGSMISDDPQDIQLPSDANTDDEHQSDATLQHQSTLAWAALIFLVIIFTILRNHCTCTTSCSFHLRLHLILFFWRTLWLQPFLSTQPHLSQLTVTT